MGSRQRSGEGTEPVNAGIALGQRWSGVKGGFVLMALDVDPNGAFTVESNSGECFGSLVRAERASLVPHIRMGMKMLEPGREYAWRVPCVLHFPEDSVQACLEWRQSSLVAFVSGEKGAVEDSEEGRAVDDEEIVGANAAPPKSNETANDFSGVDVADLVPVPGG